MSVLNKKNRGEFGHDRGWLPLTRWLFISRSHYCIQIQSHEPRGVLSGPFQRNVILESRIWLPATHASPMRAPSTEKVPKFWIRSRSLCCWTCRARVRFMDGIFVRTVHLNCSLVSGTMAISPSSSGIGPQVACFAIGRETDGR